jgi:hypothetical protein
MRDKEILKMLEKMTTLYQYLYLSGDHFIDVVNTIGVTLRIRMTDRGEFRCQNMNFPETPALDYTENMTIPNVCAMIEQLEEAPACEFPKKFENRWEEIEILTRTNLSLNR